MISIEDYAKIPHDLPYQEPPEAPTFKCDFCGDDVPEYDKVLNVDCQLCSDCVGEYCKSKAEDSNVVSTFIGEKKKEFYAEWYFKGLEKTEQISLLEEVYKIHSKGVDGKKDQYFTELEKEFCLEDDGFFEHVREGVF